MAGRYKLFLATLVQELEGREKPYPHNRPPVLTGPLILIARSQPLNLNRGQSQLIDARAFARDAMPNVPFPASSPDWQEGEYVSPRHRSARTLRLRIRGNGPLPQ